jgi:hypothetical protein
LAFEDRVEFMVVLTYVFSEAEMDRSPYWDVPAEGSAPMIRARLLDRVGEDPLQIGNLLSQREQDKLLRIAKLIEYPRPGMTIFRSEKEAEFVYVVNEGIVRITRVAANGQRRILAFMVHGDLFGMPDCGVYVNSAETVSPAKLYRFPWPTNDDAGSAECASASRGLSPRFHSQPWIVQSGANAIDVAGEQV